ncbi:MULTISPECIES: hypothetical protein [Pseudomonas]|uniref:hypothetical protein n=1 Tax=Pseudomonas TaxID=286 RepID=UPI0013794AA4|nr:MULTISPECIES: hypothetical protein [Pseudomonas]QQQ52405.1 hypothetical protein JJQ97_09395 [Pseudomonas syringae]
MKQTTKPVTLLVTPEQYEVFKKEQARLNVDTGIAVSMSQTVIRAAMCEIKRAK